MRKRRELAAGSSVRRMSRSMVSAEGGKVCARAARLKTALAGCGTGFDGVIGNSDCMEESMNCGAGYAWRYAWDWEQLYHRCDEGSFGCGNAGVRSDDDGAVRCAVVEADACSGDGGGGICAR